MAKLSAKQIAEPAHNAGFTDTALVLAVAIALAESGGNTLATHKNTNGSTDYGLWQINSVHASLLREYTWSNPQDNAIMAHRIYADAGNKFTPWSTYKSGRYLAFMSVARSAVSATGTPLPSSAIGDNPSAGSGGTRAQQSGVPVVPFPGVPGGRLPLPLPGTGNPLSGLSGIVDFVQLMLNPHTWIRVGMFLAGMLLLYMGVKASTTLDNKFAAFKMKAATAVVTKGAV